MNTDAAVNVVVFEVDMGGRLESRLGQGPTRAGDCVRQIWADLCAKEALRPESVHRIYSEWEPSAEDIAWLDANFPKDCKVQYSFSRPATAAGWDEAMRQAQEQMRERAAKRAVEEMLAQPKNRLDDIMPVLRTSERADILSEAIVNRPVGPGLSFFLAHVN